MRALRIVGLGIAIAVLLLILATSRRAVALKGSGLSVAFVALTNNPVAQFRPYRLCAPGSPNGVCALFRLRNTGRSRMIGFETVGVEQLTEHGWEAFSPNGPWQGMTGDTWGPGSSCLFAIGWPPGLPSNASWRLVLRSRQELTVPAEVINQKFGKQIFHYNQAMTFNDLSSPVLPVATNKNAPANAGREL